MTGWLTDDEQRLWRAYLDAQRCLAASVEAQLGTAGLSGADFALLVPLSEEPAGALRPRELGVRTGWDRSRLSHQLRRMEQRGLVRRTTCETDARGTVVELTDVGRRAVEAVAPEHVATVRASFVDLLTPVEVETLTAVFERVRDAAPPAACAGTGGPDAACDDD